MFYALLSLGLAVIFGTLNIINFAHGVLYMMGAFVAFFLPNGIDVPTLTSRFQLIMADAARWNDVATPGHL